jgi:hypothetical protein
MLIQSFRGGAKKENPANKRNQKENLARRVNLTRDVVKTRIYLDNPKFKKWIPLKIVHVSML